jgi:hypothetical protein
MAEYVRNYTEAPSKEEIETGYAPSTIRGTPFVKFLFWTFAGLAITYAVTYGVTKGIDAVVQAEMARHERIARQRPVPLEGPRLQPSPGHDTLDHEDMAILAKSYDDELLTMGWQKNEKATGQIVMGDAAVRNTLALMEKSAAWKPDRKQ